MEDKYIEVKVKTPSRLHFGIIDMRGDMGRIHGSAGVAIKKPGYILRATKSKTLQIKGFRDQKVEKYARLVMEYAGLSESASIHLQSKIPEHNGFGSGTQLALAVSSAFDKLYGLNLDLIKLAWRLGRSRRSGIGTHVFMVGGFVVDGGRSTVNYDTVPPLIFRSNVPEDWRFVIGLPHINLEVSGKKENKAFLDLEPPPAHLIGQVSRVVLMQMLPGILEKDIETFGGAITRMDSMFGDYWIKVQGGRYGHPWIEEGVNFLLENGAYGAGQTSWGPAFYGLADSPSQAEEICSELEEHLNKNDKQGEAFIAQPQNTGAEITISED